MNKPRLLVSKASGQLGRLVIEHLRGLDPRAGNHGHVPSRLIGRSMTPLADAAVVYNG